MKKIICILIALSILSSSLFMIPKPVIAADGDAAAAIVIPFLIVGGVVTVFGLVLNAIYEAGENEKEKELANQPKPDFIEQMYNGKIDKWIFADMLTAMGAPDKVSENETGKIAYYDKTETKKYEYTKEGAAGKPAEKVVEKVRNGDVWTYTFDKKSGKLSAWTFERYSNNEKVKNLKGPSEPAK